MSSSNSFNINTTNYQNKKRLTIYMVDSHSCILRGGAIQCVNLAITLSERGHSVSCFFAKPTNNKFEKQFDNLKKHKIPIFFYDLKNPFSILKMRQQIIDGKPEIIHTHKNKALWAVFLSVFNKKQFVWFANRGTVYSLKTKPFAFFIHKHFVDKIIAVSDAVKNSLIRDGIDKSKIEVVYGSFDPHKFHPSINDLQILRKWGILGQGKVVGLIGSFVSKKKGHKVFLQAAKLIINSHPYTYFVLIGDGNYKDIYNFAKSLGIEKNVFFPGFCENVENAISALDIIVSASLYGEGLTGTLREALAMEKPVISTDVAGNNEIIHNHKTGLLVPPGDPEALCNAIIYLIDNPEKSKLFAKQGHELVHGLCTNEYRTTIIEKLYKSML
jgi:glycosyltransferase involved in cell wall biosynthesis